MFEWDYNRDHERRADAIGNFIRRATLRAIKRAFDPNLVLNPGKIFDV